MRKFFIFNFIIASLFFSSCTRQLNDTRAKGGVLDLRDKSFSTTEIYALQGEWDFYWQKLYPPEYFNFSNSVQRRILPSSFDGWQQSYVPSVWSNSETGKRYHEGYATYHLRVLLPESVQEIGLLYEQIPSAAKIFINGIQVDEVGRFSTEARGEIPHLYTDAAYFNTSHQGTLDIVIYVSNFFHSRGGLKKLITIGKKETIKNFLLRHRSFEIFFLGSFLIISFYHFMLFLYQRFDRSTLIFSLLSFDVGIRIFTSGQKVAQQLFPNLPADIFIRAEYISWYMGVTLFLHFLMQAFEYFKYRTYVRLNYFISIGFTLWALFTPPLVFTKSMYIFQVIFSVQLISSFFFIFRAYLDRKYGTRFLSIAAIVMIASVLYDVLIITEILPQIGLLLSPYGILFFFYAQIALLAQKFYDSFRRSVFLTEKLQEKNQEFLRIEGLKDEFILNTSVKFKSPLMGILGITDYMLTGEKPLDETNKQNVLMINSFSNQLLIQINDSLDFSRILHHDIKLDITLVELNKILLPSLSMWEAFPKEKNIAIENNIAQTFYIYADEQRLQQNIYNLIRFVHHYSSQEAIQINASAHEENLVLSIESPSFSFPATLQEQGGLLDFQSIFSLSESFADNFSQSNFFNLSLVAKLLELQNGKLQPIVKNNQIKGFFVFVPLGKKEDIRKENSRELSPTELSEIVESKEVEILKPSNILHKTLFTPTGETKSHVLIISSDPMIATIMGNYLRSLKITSTIVDTGQQGFNSLTIDSSLDAIIVDSMLDDMSGYEFCRKLRTSYSNTVLPVLMITLSNRMNEILTVFESGANDYVSKPFEKNEFLVRINLLLTLREAAIERKKIGSMEKELKLAKKIQDSLLPKEIPQISSIAFATLYLPMSMIGGDYYDIKKISDTSFSVLVADVSGHGVPAALIASMLKIALQHHEKLLPFPGKLLTSLNHDLCENLESNFLTAIYAFFDLKAKTVTVARAGHPPVLSINKAVNEVVVIQPQGHLIGFYDDTKYEEEVWQLKEGDRYIFYSDGISEINRSGQRDALEREEYGDTQFAEFIRLGSALRAREFISLLVENIFDYSGMDTFDDDLTMVVVDYFSSEEGTT